MQMLAEVVADGSTEKLNKMMEAGELDPTQVMPLFAQLAEETADANGAYEKSLDSARTAQRRLRFEYEQFVKVFYTQGGEDGFSKVFNSFAKFLRENGDIAKGLGETWERFGSIIERVMVGIDNLADGFSMLSQKFGIAEGDMLGLSVVALTLMTRFGRITAAVGILFLVLEDIAVGMKGGESYTKYLMDFLDENTWATATLAVAGFAVALGSIATAIVGIGTAMKGLPGGKGAGSKGLITSILGSTVELVKNNPLTAATAAAITGNMVYHSARLNEHGEGIKSQAEVARQAAQSRIDEIGSAKGLTPEQLLANMAKMPTVGQDAVNQFNFGDLNLTFSGSPDQMMNEKGEELKHWFVGQIKSAIVNTPLTE
jgi:hypothetical protein